MRTPQVAFRIAASIAAFCLSYNGSQAEDLLWTVADTTISSTQPDQNFGQHNLITIGSNVSGEASRGLFRFDLSGISENEITNATVAVGFFMAVILGSPEQNAALSLYAISDANAGWTENEATWNRMTTTSPWSGSAGLSTPEVDYYGSLVGSASMALRASPREIVQFSLNDEGLNILRNWISNPSANAGFIMRAEGLEAQGLALLTFRNRESSFPPLLILNQIPEPPIFALIAGGLFLIALLKKRASMTLWRRSPFRCQRRHRFGVQALACGASEHSKAFGNLRAQRPTRQGAGPVPRRLDRRASCRLTKAG